MNYLIILGVTLVAFMGGALWYGPLFGNLWMKIHGMDGKTKEELKASMDGMWKLMVSEFVTTLMLMIAFAFFVTNIEEYSALALALVVWLGFAIPMTVSPVIWGNDKQEWICTKIGIMLGFRAVSLVFAGFIFGMWL